MIKKLLLWWKEYRCDHMWRPALKEGLPCRVCRLCERAEVRSVEDFYAQFGRMPFL